MKTKLIKQIQKNLTPNLLKKEFRDYPSNKFYGFCYVASECYFYLSKEKNLQPFSIKVPLYDKIINHWFLKNSKTNSIIDITKEQFPLPIDYSQAKKASFLTKFPSYRTLTLMNANKNKKIIMKNKFENPNLK